jgi:hypothetical protein
MFLRTGYRYIVAHISSKSSSLLIKNNLSTSVKYCHYQYNRISPIFANKGFYCIWNQGMASVPVNNKRSAYSFEKHDYPDMKNRVSCR